MDDWEMELFALMERLCGVQRISIGEDLMRWSLSSSRAFQVKSYYQDGDRCHTCLSIVQWPANFELQFSLGLAWFGLLSMCGDGASSSLLARSPGGTVEKENFANVSALLDVAYLAGKELSTI
ncbi:hypothetical protein Acr_28g0009990 [Actinidia rufa]|uniref:Uncharacterized protein n=1 Tax=Actinidia rufa TaxID=165716 RepID=A0A7J0HC24_9ERIC|nr:hypothetical protein Acr_28g0009990 [Actinidia rufa]